MSQGACIVVQWVYVCVGFVHDICPISRQHLDTGPPTWNLEGPCDLSSSSWPCIHVEVGGMVDFSPQAPISNASPTQVVVSSPDPTLAGTCAQAGHKTTQVGGGWEF